MLDSDYLLMEDLQNRVKAEATKLLEIYNAQYAILVGSKSPEHDAYFQKISFERIPEDPYRDEWDYEPYTDIPKPTPKSRWEKQLKYGEIEYYSRNNCEEFKSSSLPFSLLFEAYPAEKIRERIKADNEAKVNAMARAKAIQEERDRKMLAQLQAKYGGQ